MRSVELVEILRTQADLGRTQDGWDLGKGMAESSAGSIQESSNEDFLAKECLNCRYVSSADDFVSGCPNCGSKDHKTIEVTP